MVLDQVIPNYASLSADDKAEILHLLRRDLECDDADEVARLNSSQLAELLAARLERARRYPERSISAGELYEQLDAEFGR